eukprot:GHVP01036760.1.p2 GENE.GHVP01036760.1~~GHVP01036760.1.p2  ORF type:complete len:158 (+),score=32.99 GHVP01036760.1:406-879(+)
MPHEMKSLLLPNWIKEKIPTMIDVFKTKCLQTLLKPTSCFNSINITIEDVDNNIHKISADKGKTLLDVLREKDIFIEGACGGMCGCSTCHVLLDSKTYNRIDKPTEKEEDMIEESQGQTPTSRLACCLLMGPDKSDMFVKIPHSKNIAVDGYRPEAH